MTERSLITLKGISKHYEKCGEKVQVLSGINLEINSGEFVSIMGESGSGKSTLMNILGCLDVPSKGKYYLDGEDTSCLSSKQLDNVRSRKIGFIFQKFCLIPTLTAVENVCLPLMYMGIPPHERRESALSALKTVGLYDRAQHRPNEMSGGQQQRVAIARAIVTDSKIILADEPTGNLDRKAGDAVINLLDRLNSDGKTVVLITHDERTAQAAKRHLSVKNGQLPES